MPRLSVLVTLVITLASSLGAQEPFRRTGHAFGVTVAVAAAGPDWGRLATAIDAELEHLATLETLVDGNAGALGDINQHAGGGPRAASPDLVALLQRALTFCHWSEGRHGPLGGWLYSTWGLREPVTSLPDNAAMNRSINLSSCELLTVDSAANTVALEKPARLDLWGFERGFSVDTLLDRLSQKGVGNVTVRIGNVQGARGEGPDGQGWPLSLPLPSKLADLYGKTFLFNESMAIASPDAGKMRMGGLSFAPFLDQRSGQPPEGVAAAIAAAQNALDAEALAATVYIAGSRHGTYLITKLRPPPSVLWWLGTGKGEGLLTDYRWSRRKRRPSP
ncbi:MAG: FAD:protein FMN transferase [Thermoanaerobaculia bacterium]|nr:FAD:protein FMN transferase [Thermoanaerobaculia bacterium]